MLRKLVRDSAIYTLSGLLTRGLALITFPLYTRVLAPADYGVLDTITFAAAFVNVTVALEITQGLGRYYSDAHNPQARREYASTAFWFTLAVYTLFALVTTGVAAPIAEGLIASPGRASIVRAAAWSIWAGGLLYTVQDQLRWQLRPMANVAVAMLTAVASVAVSLTLVVGFRIGIVGVFYGQLVGASVGLLLGLVLMRGTYRPLFDLRRFREMISFSLPLVPSSLGVVLAGLIDRVAIRALMTLSALGLYGVGFRLASVASLAVVGVFTAFTPLVLSHYRESMTPLSLAKALRLFAAFTLILFLALSLFSRELVRLVATHEYIGATSVIPLLVPATILSGMYVFAPGLAIAKKTRTIAVISLFSAGINVALSFSLIPSVGIVGAAIGFLASAVFAFIATMAISQRHYSVPHDWPRLSLAVVCVVGLVVIGVVTRGALPEASEFALRGTMLGCGCLLTISILLRKELHRFLHWRT